MSHFLAKTLCAGARRVLGHGVRVQAPGRHGLKLATTTSYLESAAIEILGDGVGFVRLAELGTCPGHFDIRPGRVTESRNSAALIRFDFQRSLDARLSGGEPK